MDTIIRSESIAKSLNLDTRVSSLGQSRPSAQSMSGR
jgi:hypothetical protein